MQNELEKEPQPEDVTVIESEIPSGRTMVPTGPMYLASQKAINLMTDEELKEHILKFKTLVRASEQALDYRRTQLSLAINESEHREDKIRRHIRNLKFTVANIKVSVDPQKSAREKWNGVIAKLKAQGKTDAEIADMLKTLNQLVQRSK